MARQKASVEYNDFTKGFITEASPLTFPENASLDEENININREGSRQRRFGMDWSDVANNIAIASPISSSGYATSAYSWFSAGNDGESNFGVLQHGRTLYFYDLDAEDVSETLLHTQSLSTLSPSLTKAYRYTEAYGHLIVACGSEKIARISWDGSSFTLNSYRLEVRDLWGIDDGLDVDQRSATITISHHYNLKNQGFPHDMKCVGNEFGSVVSVWTPPIGYCFTSVGVYPSNADLVWASKLANVVPGSVQTDNIDAFSPWEMLKYNFAETPAPKGKFVIDLFDRSGLGATTGREAAGFPMGGAPPADKSVGSVTSVSAFAGRTWYTVKQSSLTGGDAKTPSLNNMVLYSQASDETDKFGKCHPRNDPTSENLSDLLASDGGFISIPEAGEIFTTVPLGESLFVFASNGVWEIFGGDTTFSASTQSVLKVTDRGVIAPYSIVVGGNLIGYWSESGIYSISLEGQTLRGIATNITEETIQEYYDDIPTDLKKIVIGSYDGIGKKVSWLYNLEAKDSDFYFDKELLLDVARVAFTKRRINSLDKTSGHGPYILNTINLKKLLLRSSQEVVTDSAVDVTDGGIDVTTTISDAEQKTKTSLMYWIADYDGTNENFRLGGYLDVDFEDYPRIEDALGVFGSDAHAYLLTGYLTGGDSSREKSSPYISVKSKRTETDWEIDGSGNVTVIGESSCSMQAQWEWTNDPLAGKWSTVQEVYRLPRFFTLSPEHTFAFDVVNTRNKVKGSGRALSLLFSSSPGKDMYLYGWGQDIDMDAKV